MALLQPFSWRCPFCGNFATIADANLTDNSQSFNDGNKRGELLVAWRSISCPNPKCREYTLQASVYKQEKNNAQATTKWVPIYSRQLVPEANVKVLPDYVPAAIVADYREACLIAELSPKASATLSRRCLQGMIRDFWGVKKKTLYLEIDAIKTKVDGDAWKAITAVRKIGNIGAHMEKDINLIVDVEPDEAKLLIELIERLIDEWYVARHDREESFGKLVEIAESKKAGAKKAVPEPDTAPGTPVG